MAVKEKNKKSKKPFLAVGLFLLAATLIIGGIFLATGSIVFLSNALGMLVYGGLGAGLGYGAYKGVQSIIARKNKNKSAENTRSSSLNRTRSQSQDLEYDLEEELEDEEEKIETIDNPVVDRTTSPLRVEPVADSKPAARENKPTGRRR